MTYEQAENWRFNPFDLTKVWPHKEFPLRQVGKLIFNRNPKNYFAEVEQMAYSPAHLVPGIEASPDKMLQVNLKLGLICKSNCFFTKMYIDLLKLWLDLYNFREDCFPTMIHIVTGSEQIGNKFL